MNSRKNGYCDPSDDDDYVSEGRVITQMTFVQPIATDEEGILDREVVGTFSNNFEKTRKWW